MVGDEGCKNASIEAHSIPMASLDLIAKRNKVIASCAVPPRDPVTYHYYLPLANRSIRTFGVGRWSCKEHDRLFAPVDSKKIDFEDRRNLFLIVYRTTLRAAQLGLRTVERIATPTLDPVATVPQGVPESYLNGMRKLAVDWSLIIARLLFLKWRMDALLKAKSYEEIEYRTSTWRTEPMVAGAGMNWYEGPGNGLYWGGEDSILPEWIIVLPQEYGQAAITASIRGSKEYASKIHDSMPKVNKGLIDRGKLWTKAISNRLINRSIDIAISNARYAELDSQERQTLQDYFQARSIYGTSLNRGLPNLLDLR